MLSEGVVAVNDSFSRMFVGTAGEVAEVMNDEKAPEVMEEAEGGDQDEVFTAVGQAEKSQSSTEAAGEGVEMEASEATEASEEPAGESVAGESEDTAGTPSIPASFNSCQVSDLDDPQPVPRVVAGQEEAAQEEAAQEEAAQEEAAAKEPVEKNSEPTAVVAEEEGVLEEVEEEVSKPVVSKEALARKER